MSVDIQLFSKLQVLKKMEVAQLLSDYTNGKLGEIPQMLPVSVSDIRSKHVGIVALQSGNTVGYVGAITPESWQGKPMAEVGSLMVLPAFRKQGVAHTLVAAISKELVKSGVVPYAFCNPASKPIFEQTGYALAATAAVPASAFSACGKCPMQPANGCCDQVLVYGGKS